MSQSETKAMPEAREFELFYSAFTGGLTVRSNRSAFVMLANNVSEDEYIDVIEKYAYSSLKAECERLKEISAQRLDDISFTRKELRAQEEKITALTAEYEKLKSDYAVAIGKYSREKDDQITALVAENADFRTALELLLPEVYCLMTQLRKPKRLEYLKPESGSVAFAYHNARAVLSKHKTKPAGKEG